MIITVELNGTTFELGDTHAFYEDKQDAYLLEELTAQQQFELNQCKNFIASAVFRASQIIKG